MACTGPLDAFRQATENLSDDLFVRASYRSIMLNLVPKGMYDQGKGTTTSTFTIGRVEATADEETWTAVTLDTIQAGQACDMTWNDVQYGFDEHTYGPEKFGLRGPVICQDELTYDFRPEEFMTHYLRALAKRSERSISNRLLKRYMDLVPKSIAAKDYARFDVNGYTLPASVCELSQEMLDQTAQELNEDGASDPNSDGWIDLGADGPIYPLYIGQEASQLILLNNAELRADARFADMGKGTDTGGSILFKRLGAGRVIKNYRHVINLFPPRYTYSAGAYVRVNTWEMVNGTKGKVARVTAAWKAAPFEAALVLSPWVMHEEVVKPVNSLAGLNWTPKSYFGEWQFVTGGKEISDATDCYDPLKTLGRHFARYYHAIKPIFPEFGRWIVFMRCPSKSYNCVTCS